MNLENPNVRTVLVVDDDQCIRLVLESFLKRAGYRVLLADSAVMALMVTASEQVDVALIDLQMPSITGFDLCRRLRAAEQTSSQRPIRIWLMSGAVSPQTTTHAIEAGALGVLAKPFDRGELLAEIERALEGEVPKYPCAKEG